MSACSNENTAQLKKNTFPYKVPYIYSTYIKSTTVYVPLSELGLSQPLSRQRVCPSPQHRGGGGGGGEHTRLRVRGWGSPNSDDWRKGLALCLLCAFLYEILLYWSAQVIIKLIRNFRRFPKERSSEAAMAGCASFRALMSLKTQVRAARQ